MIWSRGRQTNGLRSTLRGSTPPRCAAFDDLTSGDALEVLRAAPTPELGRLLSSSKIASALRRGGRQRRVEERAGEIQDALRAPSSPRPPQSRLPWGYRCQPDHPARVRRVAQPNMRHRRPHDVGALRMFFTDEGSGDPPLLFVHGYTCDSHDWSWQLSHFARSHRVIAVDLRGHGRSSAPEDG